MMVYLCMISLIKKVPAGTKISYGCTYTTKRDTKIATVPIGYADGYLRLFSGKAHILVDGKRAAVIGRICMDQMMVDVTDIFFFCILFCDGMMKIGNSVICRLLLLSTCHKQTQPKKQTQICNCFFNSVSSHILSIAHSSQKRKQIFQKMFPCRLRCNQPD